jgi:thermitase
LLDVPGLAILEEIADLRVQKVAVPQGQEQAMVHLLTQDPRVEYAELDHLVHATIFPNDPGHPSQWGPSKIMAPSAWDVTTGSSDIVIAILDTGVDLNHPDLNDKIVPGWDFANDDNDPQDDHEHGSHVAGIAAAETNNATGIAGISWQARIMPVKVLDENGDGFYSDVAEGVLYACSHGAQIINLSLGGSTYSATLEDAVQQAYEDGCLIVAAAGNGGGDFVDYPARFSEVMAVAATNESDIRAGFSDYGPQVEVAAPGVNIYSTLWNDKYGWKSGTSMAAPHVAGQAALIWSVCPNPTNQEVRSIIDSTADDRGASGWDPYYGYGRINALDAVQAATPALTLLQTPEQMIFLADENTGPWPLTLFIGNDAPCGSLSWDVTDDAAWLDTDPFSGQASASQSGQTTVTVDKSGLTAGNTYTATITIDSATPGVLESPQTVAVKFVYSDTPLAKTVLPLAMAD